ncbi:MAG: hypothetical protein MUF50_03165 [Planctomycetes bacterium]|jgi:hypothetical protein|nr:hypothetical protein [Planctomycetota bacterium]
MAKTYLCLPGWLDCGENYGYSNSLNIWEEKMDLNKTIDTDYIIGYSVGAILALKYWQNNKNLSLILVNPIIEKKGLFLRWLKCLLKEGTPLSFRRLRIIIRFVSGLTKLKKLLTINSLEIIKKIPKEKIIILRGENDNYLCDKSSLSSFASQGIKIIDINNAAHNWNNNFNQYITSLLN